jgi:hypothetical protein
VTDCGFVQLRGDFASGFPGRIQLGPDPGLYVEPTEAFAFDPHTTYGLLTGPSQDWPTEVKVEVWDMMVGSLWTWLALHEPQMANLVAEGDWADSPVMPALIGIDAKQRTAYTGVLIGQLGLAALVRPPGQSLPMVPMEKLFTPDSPMGVPFPLFVRQFGSDESVVQRVITLIRSWKDAGRPSSGSMLVRAYRKDIDYKLSKGEVMLEKPRTHLVIKWQPSA